MGVEAHEFAAPPEDPPLDGYRTIWGLQRLDAVEDRLPGQGRIATLEGKNAAGLEMMMDVREGLTDIVVLKQNLKGMPGHEDEIEALVDGEILGGTGQPADTLAKR
jgi:hypothetical protein